MPPNKMERFTPAALHVLSLAQEAAQRFLHSTIGTEHLLLAFVTEDEGFAGQALRSLEIGPVQLMQSVKQRTDGKLASDTTSPTLAPDTQQVLKFAVDEAQDQGNTPIGTEHLLLALLKQSDCGAIELLKSFGVDVRMVRDQLSRVLELKRATTKPSDALLSIPPSNPKPASFQSRAIEHLLITTLQMIGDNKFSPDQGIELLSGLFPPFTLASGGTMQSSCQFVSTGELKRGEARIKIIDERTKQLIGTNFDQVMPLERFLSNMSIGFIVQSALRHQIIVLEFSDGKITFHVEYRLSEDTP